MVKYMRLVSLLVSVGIVAAQLSCTGAAKRESAREQWRRSGVVNYKMTVNLQKPGHATPNGKFLITVRGGKVESIRYPNGLQPVPPQIRFGSYRTVEEVFDYIEMTENIAGAWNRKEIEYDPKLGYPKRVNLDKHSVNDEEILFEVLEFEVID